MAEGNLKITPASYVNTWNAWLRDCRDWCISRQLWWGHRVPAYRVALRSKDSGEFQLLEVISPAPQNTFLVIYLG